MTVPAGTPLVVAAAAAGVEIPVFCYEPRLGPPIGACRMCLVEVEMNGRPMPKLQAACTMTVSDNMVVRSDTEKARDGQDAVLEFILLNHPLDCPVCDKGGECPLQDLTYRYGPANTRNRLPKRTYEKPLPISPSIILDRERCILCYRCTRFSNDVAEDGELIARERGNESVIATFEEKAYENVFSGNVTELCPVGALLPTPYRFKARPWEIVNVPTICQGCPVGCNTWVTLREGNAERVLSRNHPQVDEGWLCDRGRFARAEPRADRLQRPVVRGEDGLHEVDLETAAASVARRLRHLVSLHGRGAIAILTSGDLTNEEAFGWSLVAEEVGAVTASAPVAAHADWERVDPYAARIHELESADLIVVVGDAEIADRAAVADLRIRKGRRGGAHLAIVGPGGSSLERDATEVLQTNAHAAAAIVGGLAQAARDAGGPTLRPRPATASEPRGALTSTADFATAAGLEAEALAALGRRLAAAARPVLVVTDDVSTSWLENLGWTLGLDGRPGGLLPLPHGANERGARAAGLTGGADEVLPRSSPATSGRSSCSASTRGRSGPTAPAGASRSGRPRSSCHGSPSQHGVSWSHVASRRRSTTSARARRRTSRAASSACGGSSSRPGAPRARLRRRHGRRPRAGAAVGARAGLPPARRRGRRSPGSRHRFRRRPRVRPSPRAALARAHRRRPEAPPARRATGVHRSAPRPLMSRPGGRAHGRARAPAVAWVC